MADRKLLLRTPVSYERTHTTPLSAASSLTYNKLCRAVVADIVYDSGISDRQSVTNGSQYCQLCQLSPTVLAATNSDLQDHSFVRAINDSPSISSHQQNNRSHLFYSPLSADNELMPIKSTSVIDMTADDDDQYNGQLLFSTVSKSSTSLVPHSVVDVTSSTGNVINGCSQSVDELRGK